MFEVFQKMFVVERGSQTKRLDSAVLLLTLIIKFASVFKMQSFTFLQGIVL